MILDVEAAVASHLSPRPREASREWRFWELRTFKMHRVVAEWRPAVVPADPAGLEKCVRQSIQSQFKASWWRGMGFGVVVELDSLICPFPSLVNLIDKTANGHGTWQWLLVVENRSRRALGVHTWQEGFLTPVFKSLLLQARMADLAIEVLTRQKGRFMDLAVDLANAEKFVKSLGTGEPMYKDFKE